MKTVMMFAAGVLIGVPPLLLAQHHGATTGKPVAIGNESTLVLPDRPWDRAVSVADELQMPEPESTP